MSALMRLRGGGLAQSKKHNCLQAPRPSKTWSSVLARPGLSLSRTRAPHDPMPALRGSDFEAEHSFGIRRSALQILAPKHRAVRTRASKARIASGPLRLRLLQRRSTTSHLQSTAILSRRSGRLRLSARRVARGARFGMPTDQFDARATLHLQPPYLTGESIPTSPGRGAPRSAPVPPYCAGPSFP